MRMLLDPSSIPDYRTFLKVKRLPTYAITGCTVEFPDEYAGLVCGESIDVDSGTPDLIDGLFDYQRDITTLAIRKRKFCVFADCGLGKTMIFLEFARHVASRVDGCVLIISPMMVIPQTLAEADRFYGESLPIQHVHARDLKGWLEAGNGIGITNYEALTAHDDLKRGRLKCLIVDESSMLKSHYGKWGQQILDLGRGLEWKLACTGTPAPNDRIEYANHAVFIDAYPTVNAFLARYFINRGQTDKRWELKPHALGSFYLALSHWAIFLTNPATYGWHDNTETVPPIHVTVHDVPMTSEQEGIAYKETGSLFVDQIGGITGRSALGQLGKGSYKGRDVETLKPAFIRKLVDSWPDESTIIWVIYNREQEILEKVFPEAASIKGTTPYSERIDLITRFKEGKIKVLISKPKILGFGLNLHVATRQVFSGLQDSYESYYQAVKRSNRIGSTRPLHVHIPVTDVERPMVDNVIRKAKRVHEDTQEQERIFKANAISFR